jgi:hypothetical protein
MRIRNHIRSNVIGYLALFFALSGSVAYATHPGGDNTIDSGDIINGQVTEPDIATNAVRSAEILNDSMAGGGLEQQDLQGSSVGGSEIRNNAVASGEVENDSLGSDDLGPDSVGSSEVEDFSLSNADVGAMYAEVQASGFLINSSGGISATHVGTANSGIYQVDFGRNVSLCAAVATLGSDTTGITDGEVNVADTAGNVEAVTVDTNTSNNTPADRPFRLIVLC